MKYLLSLIVILDSIFQLWANPSTVEWHIYYDLMHNIFIFFVSLWCLLKLNKMYLIAIPALLYYGITIFIHVSSFGLSIDERHKLMSESLPYYQWSFLALFLISIVYFIMKYSNTLNRWRK